MIASILIGLAIAYFLYYVIARVYKFYEFYKKLEKIPGPSFGIPFFGIVFKLMTINKQDRLDWLNEIANQHKDGMIVTWMGLTPSVHVRKPEHVEAILRSTTEITKAPIYIFLVPWLGNGILTSTGSYWHQSRKMVTPAFHFSILEHYAEVMIDKANILVDRIDRKIETNDGKPIELFELTVNAALDIICETAMGVDVHAQDVVQGDYIQAVHTILSVVTLRFFRPWLKSDFIFNKTAEGIKFNKAVQAVDDLCMNIIERKQKERKNGEHHKTENSDNKKRKAFLDILLEANEKEENPLSTKEIRDQTNTFMFAGHDTTGALVSWTLFTLGNEPEIQKLVHEELDDVLGDADDQTTLKEIPNLKYLERVIKEVLRLYPSVTGVSRALMNDLQFGDHLIPKGTTVNIQIYQAHRDASVWPDPLRFDPDRFLPENIRARHPYAYIPFSAGPRNCIGQKYGMLEAKISLAQVLRKFSVKSVETAATIKKYSDVILRPVDGIFVHMKKRSVGDKN